MDKFREECNNYNEVIDLVDKLVQLVDTSKEKEALELRDKIYEIFTKEYSEPLWNYLNLEEEIGCPLNVRLKVDIGTPIYIYVDRNKDANISIRNEDGTWTRITGDKILVKTTVLSDVFSTTKSKSFKVSSPDNTLVCTKYENRERRLFWKDYQKTWWLKQDRSE